MLTLTDMRKLLIISLLSASSLLIGCSTAKLPGVYRIDIQQGNIITQEMVDNLELGMEKRKVRFLLGTPLIQDVFSEDRWDYVYTFQPGSGERVERHISLFFDQDKLAHLEGDIKLANEPRAPARRKDAVVTVPDLNNDGGLLERLIESFRRENNQKEESQGASATVSHAEDDGFFSRLSKRFRSDRGTEGDGDEGVKASAADG